LFALKWLSISKVASPLDGKLPEFFNKHDFRACCNRSFRSSVLVFDVMVDVDDGHAFFSASFSCLLIESEPMLGVEKAGLEFIIPKVKTKVIVKIANIPLMYSMTNTMVLLI